MPESAFAALSNSASQANRLQWDIVIAVLAATGQPRLSMRLRYCLPGADFAGKTPGPRD
jgi:hypothetical protein